MDMNLLDEVRYHFRALVSPPNPNSISLGWEKFEEIGFGNLEDTPYYVQGKKKPKKRNYLNVVSWNIATGDKFNPILGHLKKIDSETGGIDILLLQEASIGYPEKYRNTFQDLGEGLGYSGVFGTCMALLDPKGKPLLHNQKPLLLGEALFTCFPFNKEEAKIVHLTPIYDWVNHQSIHPGNLTQTNRAGNRIAIVAPLQYDAQKLVAGSVHTEDKAYPPNKRGLSIEKLIKDIDEFNATDTILGGDYNTILGRFENTDKVFARAGFSRANKSSSTARHFPFRTDNIYFKTPTFRLNKIEIDKTTKSSDHYPIIARFEEIK